MGWSDDLNYVDKYNKLIKSDKTINHEKLFRKDHQYDLLIPIKYNFKKRITGKGSCIFLHLTKNYYPTAGCIALKKNRATSAVLTLRPAAHLELTAFAKLCKEQE